MIIALYEDGVSKQDIQSRMSISSYSLNKIIDAYSREGEKIFTGRKTVYQHAKAQAEEIKRLRAEGHTWNEIVNITGVSRSSVYRLLLDERDMTDDIMWQQTALAYRERGAAKKEELEIGDTVAFKSRGREVIAVVSAKQAHTLRCTETLLNGITITYSPQYQDVEIVRRARCNSDTQKKRSSKTNKSGNAGGKTEAQSTISGYSKNGRG